MGSPKSRDSDGYTMSDNYENTFREIVNEISKPYPEVKLFKVRIQDSSDFPAGAPAVDLLISIYGDEVHVATRPADFPEYSWSPPFLGKRL